MADRAVKQTSDASDLWWLGVAAGVLTMLFGVAALFWPGLTLATFVYLFSAYVLVWGVVSVVKGFVDMAKMRPMWWLSLLFGFFVIGVGVYLVRHPLATFNTIVLLLGFTFIVRGVVDVVSGIFGDMESSTARTLSILAGAIGVVAGVFVLNQPVAGGVAFVWVIGLYALLMGPLMVALAIDAHSSEA